MGGRRQPQFSAQSTLRPLEKALIAAVEAGEDFQPSTAQLESGDFIRGGLIRAMLMETPLSHHPAKGVLSRERAVRVTAHGIRIVPVPPTKAPKGKGGDATAEPPLLRIAETLDLGGMAAEGGAFLPPLELDRCIFDEAIVMAGARLQSLILKDSRFASLNAAGARFNGGVVLDGCRPRYVPVDDGERHLLSRELIARKTGGYGFITRASGVPGPTQPACECSSCQPRRKNPAGTCGYCCVIDFGSAEIAGNLHLKDSYLRAPGLVGRQYRTPGISDKRAARLIGVRVSNSVVVIRSTILGQFSLVNANVANDVWILGGRFVASAERRTVDFQFASIGGLLTFGAHDATSEEDTAFGARAFPVMVVGQVSGIGMNAGEIWMAEGFYFGHDRPKRGSQATVNFPKSDIKRTFKIGTYHEYQDPDRPIGPAYIHGEICLAAANIAKNFEIHGVYYEGIAELLDLKHPFFNYFGVASAETPYLRLSAHGLKVDRRVYISRGRFRDAGAWCRDSSPPAGQEAKGSASACLRDAIPAAVDLWKSTVGTGVRIGPGSDCIGAIRLNSCDIGREAIVDCRTIVPSPAEWAASATTGAIPVLLDLRESTISGHLRIGRHEPRRKAQAGTVAGKACKEDEAITVEGGVSLESTNVQGGLLLGHITFDLHAFAATGRSKGTDCDPAVPDAAIALNMRDFVCGSDLEVHALRWKLPPLNCSDTCQLLSARRRVNRLMFWLGGARFADIEQGPHAVIDLRGVQCGLLKDGFGGEWGLINRLQLRIAGVTIRGVEPACHEPPHTGPKDEADGLRKWPPAKVARIAPIVRLRWLSFQSRMQKIVPGLCETPRKPTLEPPGFWDWWPAFWERHQSSSQDDFVPQAFEAFSTAYRQAGENKIAQEILVEKKNYENALLFRRLGDLWKSTHGRVLKGGAVVLVALLVWLAVWTGFAPPNDADREWLMWGLLAVILVVMAWRYFVALFHIIFWAGFRYGLSPGRALLIFALCITLGWVSVHLARNGGIAAKTSWEDQKPLDENVALVLDVDPEPALRHDAQGDVDMPEEPGPNPRAAGTRSEAEAIYASPSPCNLGVSSLIYALDVFLPLIDLDQERRCAIRDALPSESDDRYFGWRLAKALYEILGWIITSLVILTITGVLRRDLER